MEIKFFQLFFQKYLEGNKKAVSLQRLREKRCSIIIENERAFSSAGSEHLPYKQRVGGSNPSTPTFHDTY